MFLFEEFTLAVEVAWRFDLDIVVREVGRSIEFEKCYGRIEA